MLHSHKNIHADTIQQPSRRSVSLFFAAVKLAAVTAATTTAKEQSLLSRGKVWGTEGCKAEDPSKSSALVRLVWGRTAPCCFFVCQSSYQWLLHLAPSFASYAACHFVETRQVQHQCRLHLRQVRHPHPLPLNASRRGGAGGSVKSATDCTVDKPEAGCRKCNAARTSLASAG